MFLFTARLSVLMTKVRVGVFTYKQNVYGLLGKGTKLKSWMVGLVWPNVPTVELTTKNYTYSLVLGSVEQTEVV
mgnify:CR=1 FL=1